MAFVSVLHSRPIGRNCQLWTSALHSGATSIPAQISTTTARRTTDAVTATGSQLGGSCRIWRFAALVIVSITLRADGRSAQSAS